jgi:hypothetical protein
MQLIQEPRHKLDRIACNRTIIIIIKNRQKTSPYTHTHTHHHTSQHHPHAHAHSPCSVIMNRRSLASTMACISSCGLMCDLNAFEFHTFRTSSPVRCTVSSRSTQKQTINRNRKPSCIPRNLGTHPASICSRNSSQDRGRNLCKESQFRKLSAASNPHTGRAPRGRASAVQHSHSPWP